jgi:CRP-like cAMP-binding protein
MYTQCALANGTFAQKMSSIVEVKEMGVVILDMPNSLQNRLLALLTKAELKRLSPNLEPVLVSRDQILNETGSRLKHIYFPTTAVVSLMYMMENGVPAEIAMVGNEGVVGIPLFMGSGITAYRAVVQSAGHAYRLKGPLLKREFDRGGTLHRVLLSYTLTRLRQTAQTAVCNRYHTVDHQLCRWFLLSLDRLNANDLSMTHKMIATALGVRREGVTEAAGKLQSAGLIRYNRGRITVLDRAGLEARVCECYETVRKSSQPLLPEGARAAQVRSV